MGLGIAGTLTEIGRIKKEDMKGLDDLIVGLLLTVVSVVVILKFRKYSLQGTTQGNGLTGADMPVRFSM